MYHLSTAPLGQFKQFTLANNAGHRVDFVPERGGCLLGLQFNGIAVLDGYQTPEELALNKWGKSGLLYPFPNRLNSGQFNWKGQEYQFPVNDTHTGNALHGFGMEWPLKIVEQQLHMDTAMVKMEGHYDGSFPYYPWAFTFRLIYRLSKSKYFEVTFIVENNADEAIPIGLGWHPYFQLGRTVDLHSLVVPPMELVDVDKRMIPTGKRYAYDEFEYEKPIGNRVLDNCFAVKEPGSELSVYLKGGNGQLRYWQETGTGKFNFLQIFTPPSRQSIALEPMSCNIDALNNGEGLTVLQAGKIFEAKAGVEWGG